MSIKNKRPASKCPDEPSTSGTKRRRKTSSCISDDEDSKGFSKRANVIDLPPMSKIYNSSYRNNKPAELFRKDLISAMKLPDSDQLAPEEYWLMTDAWKQEWERGVQVPVNPEILPEPSSRVMKTVRLEEFKLPKKFLYNAQDENFNSEWHIVSAASTVADKACRYDLDDLDTGWLKLLNDERDDLGLVTVEEITMELVMDELESQCFDNLQEAIKNQEGLGIEYDEDVICDVCRSPDSEDGNEMVFCDSCNICVHQACYGITSIPDGSWVCRTCAMGVRPVCELCPHKGGAMKSTRSGSKWAHVSCALWVPEVSIGCVDKMEPITKISHIPPSRWSLVCMLCKERVGACIQCSVKTCKTAYHVTCAFKNGLEMKAIIDEGNEDDGVKLRSYCEKHSKKDENLSTESEGEVKVTPKKKERRRPSVKKESKKCDRDGVWTELEISTDDRVGARDKRIQQVESEFYKHVSPKTVSESLQVDSFVVDCIYQYWKLKRRANFNKPLLTPKAEESNLLCRQQEDSLYARMKMFVHLRQDLERVRNLCYMVNRREKLNRSLFKLREDVFKKQVALLSNKAAKFTDKERNAIVQANHSDNVYDRLYSSDYEKFPIMNSIVSVLEGKDCPPGDLTPQKRQVKKPEKVVVTSPDKMQKTTNQPNPYAKHYFNGIRRSHRRFTSLFQLSEEREGSPSNKCRIKKRFRKDSSVEREVGSSRLNNELGETSSILEPTDLAEEQLEAKDEQSNLSVFEENEESRANAGNSRVSDDLSDEDERELFLEEEESKSEPTQDLCERKVLQAKGSNINSKTDQNLIEHEDTKINSEVKVTICANDLVVLNTEGKENESFISSIIEKCPGVEELETSLPSEKNCEVSLNGDLDGRSLREDLNKEPDSVFADSESDDDGDKLVLSPRRLRSGKTSSRSSSASSSVKNESLSKLLKKPSFNQRIRNLSPTEKSSPSRFDELDSDKKKIRDESIKVRESLFPATSPKSSSLAGYRIPKKKSESSDSENMKDRGNSPLSPLSDIAAKKMDCSAYNQKPARHPSLPPKTLNWDQSTKNLMQSPRLVIKLRKDPDSPRWRSDSYNYSEPTNDSKFHIIQNDWDGGINQRPEATAKEGENGSRYPIRFRTKAEFAS